jgi:hypothetical protein
MTFLRCGEDSESKRSIEQIMKYPRREVEGVLAHLFTHSHSSSYTKARHKFGGGDVVATAAQFIIARSLGMSLLCTTP